MRPPSSGAAGAGGARLLSALVVATGVFWFAAALYRHRTFGSALFDLGLFDQIVWNTAHGRIFACSVHVRHFLGDHFGPALALLAPLYWIHAGPATLMAVSVLTVASSALPLHAAARARGLPGRAALLLVVVFFAYPSATCIAVYDFHPDMLALPLLMGALYFESTGRMHPALGCAAAAIACKEEYAVWCAAFGLLIAATRRRPRERIEGALFALLALGYLLLVIRVLMPHFNPDGMGQLVRYAYLGSGPRQMVWRVLTRPSVLLEQLSTVKLVHFFVTFAALGFLPLRAPRYLSLGVPVWAYNLLSTHENQSFLHYQNVVPLLPPLFFATLEALAGPPPGRPLEGPALARARRLLGGLLLLAPVNLGLAAGAQWWLWVRHARPAPADVALAAEALPPGASLSTTNALGPHFSERQGLTMFPSRRPLGTGQLVDYLLLPLGPEGYRYSADDPAQMAERVRAAMADGYAPLVIAGDVVLFGRGAPVDPAQSARVEALLGSPAP